MDTDTLVVTEPKARKGAGPVECAALVKILLFCLLCATVADAAGAQTAQPTVVRWQDLADTDKVELLIQGHVARGAGRDGLHVLGVLEDNGHEMQALVVVANDTKLAVNVIPSAMTLAVTKPEEKTLTYIAPEKLARAKLRTPWLAVLGAGLQGAAAGMQTQQSTTTGTITADDGSTARIDAQTTTSDTAAQERTQERIAQNARKGRQQREASARAASKHGSSVEYGVFRKPHHGLGLFPADEAIHGGSASSSSKRLYL